jgi:hypothetical protein
LRYSKPQSFPRTAKFQLEVLEKHEELKKRGITADVAGLSTAPHDEVRRSSQALAVSIQSFIVRFIILFLALSFWDALSSLYRGLVEEGYISYSFTPYILTNIFGEWSNRLIDFAFTRNLRTLGDFAILIVLGWPLLADLMGPYRLRLRDLLRRQKH